MNAYKHMNESHKTEGEETRQIVYAVFYKTQGQAELMYMSGVQRMPFFEVEVG